MPILCVQHMRLRVVHVLVEVLNDVRELVEVFIFFCRFAFIFTSLYNMFAWDCLSLLCVRVSAFIASLSFEEYLTIASKTNNNTRIHD